MCRTASYVHSDSHIVQRHNNGCAGIVGFRVIGRLSALYPVRGRRNHPE